MTLDEPTVCRSSQAGQTPAQVTVEGPVTFTAKATRIVGDMLTVTSAFQHRKRGVETKLVIGDMQPGIDATLLRSIARAHRYFDLVRSGKTFAEIAEAEGVSKRRVQQLFKLAFLAPDAIRAVREGRQPVGMTSDWLKRRAFSPIWTEQCDAFAAL
ncbi:MAG: hypothetical protein AAF665_14435 [Pseudomonadota bacterium]